MEICIDCVIAHANGDFTGMDADREAEVRAGMDRTGHLIILSDEDGVIDQYFSWSRCDGCGTRLGGDRVKAVALSEI